MGAGSLFLHIGRGKTGTTTIQAFLSANRETLLARGIHYVHADDFGSGQGHQNFAKSFIRKVPGYMQMPVDPRLTQEAVAKEIAASDAPNVLLSSENFTLAEIPQLADFLRRCASTRQVRIVFFARSQDEVAESQYNQMVKWTGLTKTFREYIETKLDEVDYAAMLAPWAATFGRENIAARIYDAGRDSVVDDFLSCLSLAGDTGFTRPRRVGNESVGYLTLEVYRALNAYDLGARRKLYPSLFQTMAADDLPALFFSAAEARAWRERFRESNRAFLRDYMGASGDDLRGRRYSDAERDAIRDRIRAMTRGRAGSG